MITLRSLPDLLEDLDGRLRKELVQARLFRTGVDRVAGGRYRITRRIGAGGTGIVYAARDEQLGRAVALKFLRANAPTSAGRDRLRREARMLARLNHPHIVTVFGLTEYEGHCVVVMELVEGCNLRDRLISGDESPSPRDVVMVAGRGLAAAHAAGVVHGDFKPENVLVATSDGAVKVVDFGVARIDTGDITWPAERPADDTATVGGLTPAYAAPERLAGEPADAKSDQYSLCVTLCEAWTGARRPDRARPRPPRRLRRVLERGLQDAPEDRWASIEELLDALESASSPRRAWVVVAGVATVSAVPLLLPEGPDACAGRAAELGAVWQSERRARIATNLASVETTRARTIVDSLDAYAHRWNDAHRDACGKLAGPDHGDPTAIDRRFRCLRTQLDAFDKLGGALETGGPVEIASAVGAASSLPAPEDCLDARDSGLAPEVDSLLARAEVLEDVGRPEQALSLLERATLPDERATLQVDLRRADVLTTLDRRAEARSLLERVYLRSVELGHERSAAMAAIALVFNTSRDPTHHHEAATWWRHASSLLERIPADEELALTLAHARATMLRYSGERVEAMELFERVEPGVERHYGRGSKQWVSFRYHRAGACREASRFDRELELARDGYEAARAVLGDDHRLTLDIKSLLGGALVTLAHVDDAKIVLHETREAFERIYGPEHEALQFVHADLADLADLEGDLEQALAHYDAALAILEARRDSNSYAAVGLTNKRASVIWRLGDPERATAEFHRAFELTLAHAGHSSPRALEILNDLLAHQGRDEQWEAAAATLERGRAWLEHVDDPLSRAHFIYNEGVIELFRGDPDEGIRIVEQAIALAGQESSEFAVTSRMHLADLIWGHRSSAQGRARARELVHEAATISREAGRDDSAQRTWLSEHQDSRGP